METGSDLEQTSDPSANLRASRRRRRDPGEELQQSRLPRTVMPDHAEDLPLRHLKRDVPQRPDLLVVVPVWSSGHSPAHTNKGLTQSAVARLQLADAIALGKALSCYRGRHQMVSAKRGSDLRSKLRPPGRSSNAR